MCLISSLSHIFRKSSTLESAEAERFELSIPFGMPPFQDGALDRYATPPKYN